jgi:HrpA-like RNA helicase
MRTLQEALYDNVGGVSPSRVSASILHGGLSPSEQAQVFRPCSKGAVKVVFATNVAEVSREVEQAPPVIKSCFTYRHP